YLMELGGGDVHSRDAICTMLTSSIGRFSNTNLNITDQQRATPLDYLMANPHYVEVIKTIAQKAITGYGGGQYFIKDFFDIENHNKAFKGQIEAIPQQPKAKGWFGF
ncbi:MAG TPA: hypothetical protein PLD88_04085, partial [Candidatus Berkiella sp.]|nr:hypothetical protein [Candidatus Berkiella sp.]